MFRSPDSYGYFTATYNPVKFLSIALSVTYTGYAGTTHGWGYSSGCAVTTPYFFDMNIKLSYDFKVYYTTELQLSAGVQNIFNEYQSDFDKGMNRDSAYIYGQSLPRSCFAGMKVMFRIQ